MAELKRIRVVISDSEGNTVSRVVTEGEPLHPGMFRTAIAVHLEMVEESD